MRSNKMKSRFRFFLVLLTFSIPAYAQQSPQSDERAGTILVQITPQAVAELRQDFESVRPASDPEFRHTDIHTAILTGDNTIQSALGISGLHGLNIRPYIPTHNIAFEDIRERSNPQLFSKGLSVQSIGNTTNELRDAEEKLSRWFVLSYSDSIAPEIAKLIASKSSLIERAEPKYLRHPLFTPNDSLLSQQFSLSLMHVFEAWDVVRADSTLLIADVDIGTDWAHEDLRSAIYSNPGEIGIDPNGIDKRSNGVDDDGNGFIDDWHGWDFDGPNGKTPDNDARTPGSHGTHTAGIMAAAGNNRIGIAGVAFGARLLPIKVSDNNGASLDFGFEGITYAADMHAKVVNCSWGGPTHSDAEQDVVNYVYSKDCAVVAAAGNNGFYQDFYPASYKHVLAVAAVQSDATVATFSNFNTNVDVSAPGLNILSTVTGSQYDYMSGTSMASPNACACVALVRKQFPALTAGQAMEQIRVTGDTIPLLDPSRFDLEGHGTINLLRAVTDTNTHSARIDGYTIADDANTGQFSPGSSGGIIVHVLNYLKPVSDLHAALEVVNGAQYVTLHESDIPFGAAGTLQTISNQRSNFLLDVSDSVPPNTMIVIKLTFYDPNVGYDSDYDYLSFMVSPSYLDLDKNNLTVTFSSKGSIGYNDVIANTQGSGFKWNNPPPSILPLSVSVLFQGGIMIGSDPQHLVDILQNESDYTANEDLQPTKMIQYVQPPDHPNALQELACEYSDSLADPAIQLGIKVDQQAYEFGTYNGSERPRNAIVVRYVLRKNPTVSGWQPTDSTAAALFMDWDIGLSGAINDTYYDTATSTAITYRIEPGYPYIGMRVISPLPAGAAIQYHALANDGSVGDINTYDGITKDEKWLALSEFYGAAGPTDVSHSFGLNNLPLASNDSIVFVIVMALGENVDALNQTIDATARAWNGVAGVSTQALAHSNGIEAYPNPFRNTVTVTWQTNDRSSTGNNSPVHITLYDALGRTVHVSDVTGNIYNFSSLDLPEGSYTIDVLTGGEHVRKQVVVVR
jgi:serine protease